MEWNQYYGALICGKPPLNLLSIPLFPMYLLNLSPQNLVKMNHFACLIVYSPIAITISCIFLVFNCLLIPVALIANAYMIVIQVFGCDSASKFKNLVLLLLKHFAITPVLLVVSLPLNLYSFVKHLYTEPLLHFHNKEKQLYSIEHIKMLKDCIKECKKEKHDEIAD